MPIESADDLATFFNPDEFGELVSVGGGAPIAAIWDKPDSFGPFVRGDVPLDRHWFSFPAATAPRLGRGTVITVVRTGEGFRVCDDPKLSKDGSLLIAPAAA